MQKSFSHRPTQIHFESKKRIAKRSIGGQTCLNYVVHIKNKKTEVKIFHSVSILQENQKLFFSRNYASGTVLARENKQRGEAEGSLRDNFYNEQSTNFQNIFQHEINGFILNNDINSNQHIHLKYLSVAFLGQYRTKLAVLMISLCSLRSKYMPR